MARKEATQDFLQLVDGLQYRDEDSLAGELIDKLETLKRVHFGYDNFYSEYPHAKALQSSLPTTGIVPRAARTLWVKVISVCYVGNGMGYREGVDEGALPYYKEYIDKFTETDVIEFLYLFQDVEFSAVLSRTKTDERIRKLAKRLRTKHRNIHAQRALDVIVNGPQGNLHKLAVTSEYKKALEFVPTHE